MIIEYKITGNRMRKVTKIISQDGRNVNSFGYAFSDVNMKQYEILSEKEFNNKIKRIRKCEKISFGEIKGKVTVVRYRSDNNDNERVQ